LWQIARLNRLLRRLSGMEIALLLTSMAQLMRTACLAGTALQPAPDKALPGFP
jgi:hypothetical protein